MKQAPIYSKSPRHGTSVSMRRPVAGSNAITLTPPTYGIDFLDRQQPAVPANVEAVTTIQRQAREDSSTPEGQQENRTGLPDHLKVGIETLSGLSMDDVHVHYNSAKPAALQALAYTQGTEIYIGPGQETHLPHEAWHVVQQAQGRVKPTIQAKGVGINDDARLEQEADMMGAKAGTEARGSRQHLRPITKGGTAQRMRNRLQRELTPEEEAQARASAMANSTRLRGHGRTPHGRRRETPAARQEAQAERDIENAIEQAIQL